MLERALSDSGVRSLGFLMAQSVKAAFLREAGTAGTSAPTTCGANISSTVRNQTYTGARGTVS